MLQVQQNISLKNKTTIRLGGITPCYVKIKSKQDILDFVELNDKLHIPFKVLGGGSNLIIADESICKELPFGVLDIDIADELTAAPCMPEENLPPLVQKYLENKHTNFTRLHVGAGYKIPKLLQYCKENGLTGLEGLVGIPCRVGGTVSMNAGAYQTEINDVLSQVEIFHKKYGILTLTLENMELSYRKSAFYYNDTLLQDYIILGADFIFPVIEKSIVSEKMQKNLQTKKNTQPVQALTAGCVFKNPCNEKGEKISAGLLLDKAGLKDIHAGGMRFSEVHASFLENTGNGKTKDAIELLSIAKDKILTLFNIQLEEEVKIWI